MPEPWEAPQYVAARKALLDALDLLVDQLDALILVGAQAVYLHAPASVAQQVTYTTDSDLVIDPDLLSERPDIGDILLAAGYTRHRSPGTFYNQDAIPIDLIVPEGALPPSTRRTAVLAGQSRPTARRTFGLEVALFDAEPRRITALDPNDPRTVTLRVAGDSPPWSWPNRPSSLNGWPAHDPTGCSARTPMTSCVSSATPMPPLSASASTNSPPTRSPGLSSSRRWRSSRTRYMVANHLSSISPRPPWLTLNRLHKCKRRSAP